MKNRIQLLLAATLALSASYAFAVNADSDTCPKNKTFLQPRSHGVNLALEKTAGSPNLVNRHDQEDAFGGNLQASFFMMKSTEGDALARYFLFPTTVVSTPACDDDCGSITLPRAANSQDFGSTADLDLGLVLHMPDYVDVKLQVCPSHEAIGATFNYHQDLKCLLKGLYLDVAVPVVSVKNTMDMTTSGSFGTNAANLSKYFQGNYSVAQAGDTQNAQAALTKAKMGTCGRSETGVADVDLILGYKFLDKARYHAALNVGVTIPTGNKADGEWVFDAVVGNGGHVGFGVGLDAGAKLWESECCNHSLKLNFAANYRYLFENDETRTLGIKNQNFGQYLLLIDITEQPNAQQLTPAANVTTLNVDVTPGSMFDGILSLNYNFGGFAFDLGYNLFYRDSEKVCFGDACGTTAFADGKWAIATRHADMSDTVTLDNTNVNYVLQNINKADLDLASASTPRLLTHKLFAGAGYWTKTWEVPVLVGVGGHYEFADCDIISNWGFNARLGIGF